MPLFNGLHLPVFFLLLYWLWKSAAAEKLPGLIFWLSLGFKLASGLFFGWVYLHYLHGGDTWAFHAKTLELVTWAKTDGSAFGRFLFFDDPGPIKIRWQEYSNSFFFLKVTSLLYLLTGASYWWASLYMALFSFWGCWFLALRIRRFFPDYGIPALLALLFFPSVVFWTSGFAKDSLLMGSLCLTAGLYLQLTRRTEAGWGLGQAMLLVFSIWFFWRVKFFLAAVLLVLLSSFLLMHVLSARWPWLRSKERQLLAWVGLMCAGAFVASFAHPAFQISFFVRHIVWNYTNLLAISDLDKPLLTFSNLQPTLYSVLRHAPKAVLQMVYRPFVWEPAPVFYRLAGLENLLLLALTVLTFIYRLRRKSWPRVPVFLGLLFLFFLIGGVLVSLPTPNLGSLHRYRAPLLPFFLILLLAWGPVPGWLQRWFRR